tara:strand:- start:663 stop:1184 length:522 start_codon:yes stop_codon:yes gene_type:complete
MKNLLIISSTKNTNYQLSLEIQKFYSQIEVLNCSLISLEEFNLPLYTPTLEASFIEKGKFPEEISKIKDEILRSDALIWCSPEYNGGISPILTNAIAWISRATDDWKDGFKDKHSLICTSSGGNGKNFIKGFTLQLNYLGSIVSEDSIIKTKKNSENQNVLEQKLRSFKEKFI